MKILTIIGARPQFVKASVVSKAIVEQPLLNEFIVHTGQHFDANMSDVFFEQLEIPEPDVCLDINSGPHGEMTGRMLIEIEQVIMSENPDRVLVYGDTNSTLAGALAAAKLHVPVAHVEAGLRSFNMNMPEEINRILVDQVSDILFCSTQAAIDNLQNEGFNNKDAEVLNVGDVMQDSAIMFAEYARPPKSFKIDNGFVLTTLHRAENTADPARLAEIVNALNEIQSKIAPVILPLHPRTHAAIEKAGLNLNVHVIEPIGYLEMLWLLKHSDLVLTDSGGVQKEAFFFGKACVTMRDETEWVELVEMGANVLTGANKDKIVDEVICNLGRLVEDNHKMYGGGQASYQIVNRLVADVK